MSRSYGAESPDSSARDDATPGVRGGKTGTQNGHALAADLQALVDEIESIEWHKVDGVSSSTAAAFASRVQAAAEGACE